MPSAATPVVAVQYLCGCGQTLRAHLVQVDGQIRVQIRKCVVTRMNRAKSWVKDYMGKLPVVVNGVNVR